MGKYVNQYKETPDILKKYQDDYNDAMDVLDESTHSLMVLDTHMPKSPLEKEQERIQRRKETKEHLANGGTAQDFEADELSDVYSNVGKHGKISAELEDIPYESLTVSQRMVLIEQRQADIKREKRKKEQEEQARLKREREREQEKAQIQLMKQAHEEEKKKQERLAQEQESDVSDESSESEHSVVKVTEQQPHYPVAVQQVKPKKEGFFAKLKRLFF